MDAASPPDSYRQVLTAEAWLESAAARDGQAGALDRPSFLLAASIFSGAMQELQQRWQQEKSQQDQSEPATPAGQEQAA